MCLYASGKILRLYLCALLYFRVSMCGLFFLSGNPAWVHWSFKVYARHIRIQIFISAAVKHYWVFLVSTLHIHTHNIYYITHIQIYSNTCVQHYLHMCEDILSSAMLREIYLNAYIHTHKQTYTNRKDIPTKTTKCCWKRRKYFDFYVQLTRNY